MIVRNVSGGRQYLWSWAGNTVKIGSQNPPNGAIAQLGERIVRNDEVVGSIPTSSTKPFNNLPS